VGHRCDTACGESVNTRRRWGFGLVKGTDIPVIDPTFTSNSVAPKSDHFRVQVSRIRTQSAPGLAASWAQRSARAATSSSPPAVALPVAELMMYRRGKN
jgi:hypothetical protein